MASTALYLTDDAGVRWRVHWVCYGPPLATPFRHKRLAVGDARANSLYFVRDDGHTRIALLRPGDDRRITPEVIAAHLARAGSPGRPVVPRTAGSSGRLGS
ncbi:MAG TPA: hypothetical protein VGD56_16700 [Gemmatirosa sp.]